MVGVSREERALSPVGFAVRKRLPWLEVNLLTAFLAASVVGLFEGTIARFTALAVLLPVVAGQSGNTGAQALAVTMRGLALREVRVRNWFRVASKEVRVAFINGIAVAVSTAAAVYLWSRSPGLTLVIGIVDGPLHGRRRPFRSGDPDDPHRAPTGSGPVLVDHPHDRYRCRRLLQFPRHRDAALRDAVEA